MTSFCLSVGPLLNQQKKFTLMFTKIFTTFAKNAKKNIIFNQKRFHFLCQLMMQKVMMMMMMTMITMMAMIIMMAMTIMMAMIRRGILAQEGRQDIATH